MKFTIYLTILTILAGLTSCSDSEPQPDVVPVSFFPDNELQGTFEKLRTNVENVSIPGNEDATITTTNGTMLFVQAETFVDENGETIEGKVELEIQEVASIGDAVRSGLQTVSDGKVLMTDGMIYVNATAAGKQVVIGNDKSIQVSMRKLRQAPNNDPITMFTGSQDEDGVINWKSTGVPEMKIIQVPLKSLDLTSQIGGDGISYDDGEYEKLDPWLKWDSIKLQDPKYQNTFIATKEFEARKKAINAIEWMTGSNDNHPPRLGWYPWTRDSTASQIYLEHLDWPLWKCDSMLLSYFQKFTDGLDFTRMRLREESHIELLKKLTNFKNEGLTGVIEGDFSDVDFKSKNARQQLINKGLDTKTIDEIIGAHQRKMAFEQKVRDEGITKHLTQNVFRISKLGWINCDRYYNDPNAGEAKILAAIKGITSDVLISVMLVIHKDNIVLSGTLTNDGYYSFTGDNAPYTKLPLGAEATIISISAKNGTPLLGQEQILISASQTVDIEMEEVTIEDIKFHTRNM